MNKETGRQDVSEDVEAAVRMVLAEVEGKGNKSRVLKVVLGL